MIAVDIGQDPAGVTIQEIGGPHPFDSAAFPALSAAGNVIMGVTGADHLYLTRFDQQGTPYALDRVNGNRFNAFAMRPEAPIVNFGWDNNCPGICRNVKAQYFGCPR